ncbi:DUF5706 domain-containing protein (plasmid) [Streptomyces uncialis]|uniref:Pycsar system effector family protein n=1 Tax=Streptomyces uncialis TaxID=1048205 RepID=UPI002E32C126|nr:Pycsar system effector family protein [Streptomyces uncialis]WTE16034.1 DUF5706 domain-containing protein [Streptomyces uncialis]
MADTDIRLDEAARTVLTEIGRADTKSGVLLTSFSLPLAVLLATVPGRDLPPLTAVLVGVAVVGLAAAIFLILGVVRPRLVGAPRGTYLYWSDCTPDELLTDLQGPPSRQAEDVVRLSRIARRKHRGLRRAIDITRAALAVLAAAAVAALL